MFYEIRWKTNEQFDRPITEQEKISIKIEIKWFNAYLFKVIWEHFVEKGEIFYCFVWNHFAMFWQWQSTCYIIKKQLYW